MTARDAAGNEASASVAFTVTEPTVEFAQVTGTVSDTAGTPLPGSRVVALIAGTSTVAASTTARVEGIYSLSLPAGTYDFQIAGPEGSGLGATVGGRVIPPGATTINWVIGVEVVTVSGRVLRDGQLVSNGSAVVVCSNGSMSSGPIEAGTYSIAIIPTDSCTVSLHAEGSFGFDGQIRDLDATQVTNLPDFDMPTHTLTLHLIQPDNTPAVGATIDLRITSPQNGGYLPFPMDGMNAYYWGPGGANGQTDSNGTAVIRLPLDATEGILYISHPNFPNLSRPYTTTGNTEATVQFDAGVTVSGRVLRDGQLVSNGSAVVVCSNGSMSSGPIEAGTYSIAIIPTDSCTVSLHAEGSFGFDGQIRDLDATQVTNLPDFDMPTHTLTLHLIQPDNTPAVGATIDLRITSPQNGGYLPFPMDGMNAYYWGPGGANGQTDSNGTAVIRLPLDATEGILYISHPNFPNLSRPTPPPATPRPRCNSTQASLCRGVCCVMGSWCRTDRLWWCAPTGR